MKHLMIDLETMGTAVNAPVLAIGAVFFNPDTGEIGVEKDRFYGAIDIADACRYGRPSGDTIKFWMGQGDDARKAVIAGTHKAELVFGKFHAFCLKHGADVRPWSNGASFDVSILGYAFPKVIQQAPPWKFWNVLDCRTIKELAKGRVEFTGERQGPAHHALYDAIFQAQWVSRYWQDLRLSPAAAQPSAADLDLLA